MGRDERCEECYTKPMESTLKIRRFPSNIQLRYLRSSIFWCPGYRATSYLPLSPVPALPMLLALNARISSVRRWRSAWALPVRGIPGVTRTSPGVGWLPFSPIMLIPFMPICEPDIAASASPFEDWSGERSEISTGTGMSNGVYNPPASLRGI